MSEPAQLPMPDVEKMVLNAPEEAWQEIKRQLKVKTREEAAALAMRDQRVQQLVLSIVGAAQKTADETLLTDQQPDTYVQSQRRRGSGSKVTV